MNEVLDILCSDHANFGKLLNAIEYQTQVMAAGASPDIAVLTQAVTYLEGYPALYHHPLEDAVYWRLRLVNPDKAADVAEILYEHAAVRQLLTRFKQALTRFNLGDAASAGRLAETAQAFVDTQWAHMEYERSGLFQSAAEALSPGDWEAITEDVPRTVDPLFSTLVIPSLRHLHNQLLTCDSRREVAAILRQQHHNTTTIPDGAIIPTIN